MRPKATLNYIQACNKPLKDEFILNFIEHVRDFARSAPAGGDGAALASFQRLLEAVQEDTASIRKELTNKSSATTGLSQDSASLWKTIRAREWQLGLKNATVPLSQSAGSSTPGVTPTELGLDSEVVVKIRDAALRKELKKAKPVDIVRRVERARAEAAKATPSLALAGHAFIAARQLPSGDISLRAHNAAAAEILRQHAQGWVKAFGPSAWVRVPTWGVVVDGVPVHSMDLDPGRIEDTKTRLIAQNQHTWGTEAKIAYVGWLVKPKRREGSLVIEFTSPLVANEAISKDPIVERGGVDSALNAKDLGIPTLSVPSKHLRAASAQARIRPGNVQPSEAKEMLLSNAPTVVAAIKPSVASARSKKMQSSAPKRHYSIANASIGSDNSYINSCADTNGGSTSNRASNMQECGPPDSCRPLSDTCPASGREKGGSLRQTDSAQSNSPSRQATQIDLVSGPRAPAGHEYPNRGSTLTHPSNESTNASTAPPKRTRRGEPVPMMSEPEKLLRKPVGKRVRSDNSEEGPSALRAKPTPAQDDEEPQLPAHPPLPPISMDIGDTDIVLRSDTSFRQLDFNIASEGGYQELMGQFTNHNNTQAQTIQIGPTTPQRAMQPVTQSASEPPSDEESSELSEPEDSDDINYEEDLTLVPTRKPSSAPRRFL
ncbi:hypothetical protein BGW36DRAFT_462253 [Talaromyces proteolyticus]|uniref:Uncharacterized protein n=1 Tax=Talaromyces proteolyticus TaxID=1131652 RepID=A0AAD4KTQ0_9EURO|nr:uncharacterized protein BGW36DRAFT_462253 [Talaromyces proteolyticus]KAH8696371.1 hypothetical protein BGW36DRAFT_462253 [Talaromyces proteolyticus]